MGNKNYIIAETINTRKFALIFMSIILGGTYLSFGVAAKIHYAPLAIIGLLLFAIIPIALMKKASLIFTKRMEASFFDTFFSFILFKLNEGGEIDKKDFYYEDIKSCVVNSTQNLYSTIVLEMANGEKKKFTFKKINNNEENSVSEDFFYCIKNRKKDLILNPTFFASKGGKNYIIGLAILMVSLLFFHIYYAPQSSPLTFIISISLFINILIKRKRDIKLFEKLNQEV